MKPVARLLSVIAVLALVAGASTAATLDRDGTWTPSVFYQPTGPQGARTLINDGSFENGPPPTSAWTEVSNSPYCEWIGDFAGSWYLSSWDGYIDYWAGGYCTDDFGLNFAVTSSVTQVVDVPAGNPELSFFYVSFRPDLDDDVPDGDHVYVAVNGVEIWTLDMIRANDTYPYWVGPIIVNVSAYAGQSVSLTFGGISVGDVTGNVRFDYIEFLDGPVPAEHSTWGSIKALYR